MRRSRRCRTGAERRIIDSRTGTTAPKAITLRWRPSFWPPGPAGRRVVMVTTRGLTHIHLMVRDLDRALAFHTRVFGLEERFREGRHMVFLGTPGRDDLITLNEDPRGSDRAGVNGGIDHFGFRVAAVADFDAAIDEAEAAGGRLISRGEHAPGVPFAYLKDPDGYTIELLS